VLTDLTLDLGEGGSLAITGESGSGKSTLLHLIGGMDKPDEGSIVIDGRQITSLEGNQLADFRNTKIGFVFQFHHLLPEFTALENVMFPLLLGGLSFSKAREEGAEILEDVGLTDRMGHQSGELSGGEQQRVAIARALVCKPRLLLGDEPTGNLDLKTSDAIHDLLFSIHEKHDLTSIIVTHNQGLAALCRDQMTLMDGRLT
jgi:lipoprotein-releasing system ATP-binding protein